jgi:hypothetical protein
MPPENTQALVRANYTFQYQLFANEAVDPSEALASNNFHEQIHDAVVEKFFRCTSQEDELWVYLSSPHVVDTAFDCTGSTPVSQRCFVVSAMESIWVYDAPRRRGRQLQAPVASRFVAEISSFIMDAMDGGLFTGRGGINLMYVGSSGGASPMEPNPVPMPTTSPSVADGKSPQEEFPKLTNQEAGSFDDSGLSTAGIAIISILGALSCIILFLVLKRRCARQRIYYEKEGIDMDIDNAAATIMEEHAEYDSMPDTIIGAKSLQDEENDPYTSASPPRRSRRAPLYSQDELDMAVGDRMAPCESFEPSKTQRKGIATDTVNL